MTITGWPCEVSQFYVYGQSSIFTPVQITQVQNRGSVINGSPLSDQNSRGPYVQLLQPPPRARDLCGWGCSASTVMSYKENLK